MRVLLATDGSEFSEDAARFLTRFDFSPADEIVILHVISEIPYEDDYSAQIRRVIRRVAPKILASAAEILGNVGARTATWEKEGYPDTTIIESATETDCDLIVMGARGVKGLKALVLGSSTRAVAVNSPKSVLVVKHPSREAPDNIKVLFATDGSDAAYGAGQFLSSLPLPSDTEITVMHVVASPLSEIPERYLSEINSTAFEEYERLSGGAAKRAEEIIERAKQSLGNRFNEIREVTAAGDPFREIIRIEQSLRPDIISVGCRGIRGMRGMMGSLSRKLLSHSDTSILIGKPCAREAGIRASSERLSESART